MNPLLNASPIQIGTQGLKDSMSRMSGHAQNMQDAQIDSHNKITNQDTVSVTQPAEFEQNIKQHNSDEQLIYSSMSGLEAKANAKVIQTSMDTMGTILDLKA